ncbi:MAG: helix-turn-helix transcriptional regulator [Lachnospiraceae bacterium]
MNFNEHLKATRKRFGVTQKSISSYIGVNLRTYQRYEEGKIKPLVSTLIKITEYFGIPIDCLLGKGFYSNWEEIIPYKDKILTALNKILKDLSPEIAERLDLTSLTESELAYFLPNIAEKITLDDKTITITLRGSHEVSVDVS